jgi:quinoprotein glucose dehydrogenase
LPPILGGEVIKSIASGDEARSMALVEKAMNRGQQVTQQSAIEALGNMKGELSAGMISSYLKRMASDDFPPALRLDIVMAIRHRKEASLKQQLKQYLQSITKPEDPASSFRDTLVGGSDEAGAKIFYGKTEVSCVRCHAVDGTGGEVGPELSGIGLTQNRQYLLEGVVHPNKVIAKGFAQVKVLTEDGDLFVGIVKRETDRLLVLMDADGKEIEIDQDLIEGVKPGQSSMPDDLVKQLTRKEIRDLVEFLVNRKTVPKTEPNVKHE